MLCGALYCAFPTHILLQKKKKAIRSVLPPPYSWYKMFSWTQDKVKEGQEPEADEVIGLPDDSTTVLIYVL